MKKMIGTKIKRTIAGQLAFVTAMIFSLPGNMFAQQAQTITAPSIGDITYSTTSFSVGATSSSGLTVSYGVAGPATVGADGMLTMIGKGSVTVFFFQDGKAAVAATYEDDGTTIKTPAEPAVSAAAPVVRTFAINGASATVVLDDASVVYDGTAKALVPTMTDSGRERFE